MATFIISGIVIALFAGAIWKLVKDHKTSPGCPGCSGCSKTNNCHKS